MRCGLRAHLIRSLAAGAVSIAGTAPSFAQQPEARDGDEQERPHRDEPIVVEGERLQEQLSRPETPLPVLDTPQTVTVLDDEMVKEQGRATLRDSLRNITGISFQAGEGNPPGGGDAFSVRGFSARDDIFVDGMRDPGNYFRDPFLAFRIEVTKGPASAFAGRGNVGGTVNIVTYSPRLDAEWVSVTGSAGTHDLLRGTVDANQILSEEHGVAVRLNAMGHSADEPGRDVARNRRWGIMPSIAFGIDRATTLRINYLRLEQHNLPDYGVPNARNVSLAGSPFAGRPAPVPRANFYGYSNDYYDIQADIVTARLEHRFSDALSLRSQLRYGRVHNDSVVSAPLFVGAPATLDDNTLVFGRAKPRDQVDTALISQTHLTWSFGSDSFHNTIVAGAEFSRETAENRRRLETDGPATNLFRPTLQARAAVPYNGTRARMDTRGTAVYLFDTIEIGPRYRIVGGARFDHVRTRVRGFDDSGNFPGYVTDLSVSDDALSWNLGLVYKPGEDSSVYLAYGTSFEPAGRMDVVQLAGGNNNPPVTSASLNAGPETSSAWELGGRVRLLSDRATLAGAVFQTTRRNGRMPGIQPGDPASVLEGEQRVRGLELQLQAEIEGRWSVFAGYTFLDGEVTSSDIASAIGRRLDNLPRHSVNLWASYSLTSRLQLGGGFQHVGSRRSGVSAPAGFIPVEVPAYTVADMFAEYRLTDSVSLRANVYNLTDAYYFQSFFLNQSIPSAARSASLSLTAVF